MEKSKFFWRKCPTKDCEAISGFCLPKSDIKENGKYYCECCQQEHKLSEWKPSTEEKFEIWKERVQSSKAFKGEK